jgi:hypothetical protein
VRGASNWDLGNHRDVNSKLLPLNPSCSKVVPSHQPLSDWQKTGLKLTSSREGRDVVLAIDLTESVGLNDEGRLRLKQIIQDSLVPGDSVYVVPFASTVNPLQPQVDLLSAEAAIPFQGKPTDIDRILQTLPFNSNNTQKYTDIQLAEASVYKGFAQLNQCRLTSNKSVKSQSVVWLTDAPLLTKPGISSAVWVETLATSPFRQQNSAESKERQEWLDALPLRLRSQKIGNYNLSVVDISPTVQEFCTPAPGGRETCLVDGYLIGQLWLPVLVILTTLLGLLGGGLWLFRYWRRLQKSWKLVISSDDDSEPQIHYLRNHQKLSIGSDIECKGGDIRGYLRREGNRLSLEPIISEELEIHYRNQLVTQPQVLHGNQVRLSCPYKSRDSELTININY